MPLRVAIHNAACRYTAATTDRIEASIREGEARTAEHVEIPIIDVTVFLSNHGIHPDWFVTGMMMARDSFRIIVNPDHRDFDRMAEQRILTCVVHELHHCLRGACFKYETLADTVVFEGMAIAAERHLDCADDVWTERRPSMRVLRSRLKRVAENPNDPNFSWVHAPIRGHQLPVMYALGDCIVTSWLGASGHTPYNALTIPATQIVAEAPVLSEFHEA